MDLQNNEDTSSRHQEYLWEGDWDRTCDTLLGMNHNRVVLLRLCTFCKDKHIISNQSFTILLNTMIASGVRAARILSGSNKYRKNLNDALIGD